MSVLFSKGALMAIVVVLAIGGTVLGTRLAARPEVSPSPASPGIATTPVTEKPAPPAEKAVSSATPTAPAIPAAAAPPPAPQVKSITVTDADVLPLLPVKKATLHFLPGNQARVGHQSLPAFLYPKITLGVTGGRLWLSGIPSWLDLARVDANFYNYASWWRPDWGGSFTIDRAAPAQKVTPQSQVSTGDTTPALDWTSLDTGGKYKLEISPTSSFDPVTLSRGNLGSPGYTLSEREALGEGTYHWRVTVEGRLWLTGMPPWLDISRFDPAVTRLPFVTSLETGEGSAKISYLLQ